MHNLKLRMNQSSIKFSKRIRRCFLEVPCRHNPSIRMSQVLNLKIGRYIEDR